VATPRAQLTIPLSPRVVGLAGLGLAFVCGALIGRGPATGVGFLLLLAYLPLVLFNLPAAIAIWIVVTFVKHLPAVSIGPTAISLLVIMGWAGSLAGRRSARSVRGALADHPVVPGLAAALLGWMTLSALWADDAGAVWGKSWQWYVALLTLVIVAGTVRTRRQVEIVMAGFIAGAVLSVTIGLIANGLAGTTSAYETATSTEGRLQGGSGDPNYLAAGIVPALALCGGLLQVWRDALARLALWLAMLVLVVGLVATQSRGGMLAAIVALLTAIVISKGRRAVLLSAVAALLAVGGVWLAANPDAVDRLTRTDQGGDGRSDLWAVAWAMGSQKPFTGVGLDNYEKQAGDYVLEVGTLRFAGLVAERPHVTHNAYLQAFAELGIPGLLLLLATFAATVVAAWEGARRFARNGDRDGTALARALVVALAGMMTASVFLSNGEDQRMWLLMGLAPTMLVLAERAKRG
jgi:O-antigen ligase